MTKKEYNKIKKLFCNGEIDVPDKSRIDVIQSHNEFSRIIYDIVSLSLTIDKKFTYSEGVVIWALDLYNYHHFLFSKKYTMRKGLVKKLVDRDLRIFRKRMRKLYESNYNLYPLDELSIGMLDKYKEYDSRYDDSLEVDDSYQYLFELDEVNYIKNLGGVKRCTRSKGLVSETYNKLILDSLRIKQ